MRRLVSNIRSQSLLNPRCNTYTALTYGGRISPYRRIEGHITGQGIHNISTASPSPHPPFSRTSPPPIHPSLSTLLTTSSAPILSLRILLPLSLSHRTFSTTSKAYAISFRDLKSDNKPKTTSPKEEKQSAKASAEEDPAEKAYREATKSSAAEVQRERGREKERERIRQEKARAQDESSGSERKDQRQQNKQENSKEPPPPPHGTKSPWQVFTETLKTEFQANKEWQDSTKQLSASAQHFSENENIKRARAAYEAASGKASSTTAQAVKGTAKAVGQGAAWTWDSAPVKGTRSGVNLIGKGIEAATRPVRKTQLYTSVTGNVKDVVDGGSSKYGGWVEKEERRRQRELREQKEAAVGGMSGQKPGNMEEDPNAGTNVTLHKDSKFHEAWSNFRDSSRVMQSIFSIRSTYKESDNSLISVARSVTDKIAGFFAENETAMVIKKFKSIDPNFSLEPFLKEMREWVLPEVLDAYVQGDTETLKNWLSVAQYQVYAALSQQYKNQGLVSDGKITDLRGVEVLSARMLDPGEVPVFILTARAQEIHVYRNAKTKELVVGTENRVNLTTYVIAVTRVPEETANPITRGWRLIELQKSSRDYY